MAPTTGPLRTAGTLLRALVATVVLLALVAGTPYLLLALGHPPTELSASLKLLSEQDDGTLLLVVLTLIGWLAWAAFALSVLLEVVALARRRSAPRIKGLGGLQSLAGALIGGIVLLAPTAASAASPATAAAVATHHTTTRDTAKNTTAATAEAQKQTGPRHTVASSRETLWDLAQQYLGSGTRWRDIAALNATTYPALASGDAPLQQGWVLQLPPDATVHTELASAPAADHHGDAQHTPATYTVRTGDSLSNIADEELGDANRWPDLYKANKAQVHDPDLIYPGQRLDLPEQQATPTPPAPTRPHTPRAEKKPAPAPDHADQQEAHTPPAAQAPGGNSAKDTAQSKPSSPTTSSPAPSRTAPPTETNASPTPTATDGEQGGDAALAPAVVWAGAGALAAALVGTLATRRILQQRRRRPGRRIPMPAGRAAATEQGLRAAQHPTGLDLLDTALRSLALNLAAAQRELPVVEAVVLHDAKVELHLAEATAPMKPFTAAAGRKDLWLCSASSPDLADTDALNNADAPYPALVSIGWDGAGHLVLIDLEHVGILNLTGSSDFARHVLQALAVELAITPLPSHLEVTALTHTAPGLDTAAPERVARLDDLASATAELTSHTDDQRRALAALGADSLRAARLMDDAADSWTPHILLVESLPQDADHTAFVEALTEEPRAASAVVTAGAAADLPATAWTLDCQSPDHTIVLPGSGVPIKLQGLSDEHYADAVEILTVAASDADVPAPAWTHTDDTHDAPTDEATDAADEDGLPAEYADDESDDTTKPEAPNSSDANAAGPTPALDLTKPQPDDATVPQSTAGPSLADILNDPGTAAPTHDDAAGPTNDEPPRTTPCSQEDASAVHVTLPAQTTTTPAEAPEPATAAVDGGPAVALLGPINVEGAGGRIDSSRRNAAVELVAFLALNPGVDHHAIDDALWPGRPVGKELRNPVISRTRSWLGKDTNGNAHLPRVQDTGDSRYRLGPAVTNDWTRFQRLARTGLTRHDEDGDLALRRALALVRGRPFTGIDPQRYAWAEPIIQEMVSAIVDVAYELAERRREAGDVSSALWAARRGLLAAEESEILHRQVFLAHHAAGDIEALREAAARLARINEQLLGGADMEAETVELLRNLLPRPVSRAR